MNNNYRAKSKTLRTLSNETFNQFTLGCYIYCYNYVGKNDVNSNVSCNAKKRYTYKNCQYLCKMNRKCDYFTFDKSSSCCYLKSGKVSLSKHDINLISGPKYCTHTQQRGN